jgi:protein tyrosine/serine phosphatase
MTRRTWARGSIRQARRCAAVCRIALLAAALAGCGTAALRPDNNFHVIVEDEAFRSAQPSSREIVAYREKYRIATIVNLRGKQEGKAWYDAEIRTAKQLGIRHVDFGMSPSKELTPDRARELIAVMRSAAKPVLIHCMAGSDRTGLAAALYLAAIAKAGEELAAGQLSMRFGHITQPIGGAYAMDRSFEAMAPSLGFDGS